MRLDPEVKKQVEAALKGPVPSPTEPEFDELLLRLRKENPELADLLESGVIFDDLPTPEEETQRAVSRREGLRLLKHRLLDRYDELTGEWVPSRPKQVAVGFVGLVLATSLWFAFSTRETKPASGGLPVPVASATGQKPVSPQRPEGVAKGDPGFAGNLGDAGTQAQVEGRQAPGDAGTQGAQPEPAPSSTPASADPSTQGESAAPTPPPPSGYSEVPPPPPGYSSAGYPSAGAAPSGAGSPTPQAAPPPLTLYAYSPRAAQAAATPAPLTLASSGSTQASAGPPGARDMSPVPTGDRPLTLGARPSGAATSSSRPVTGSVADDVAATLQGAPAPSASAAAGAKGGGLTLGKETQSTFAVRAVEGQGGQGGSFYLVGGPAQAQAPQNASPQGSGAPNLTNTPTPAFPASSPPFAPPASAPTQAQAAPTLPAAPYTLGTRLKGRLGVGVLIAERTPGAVAIDAEDGSTWVGEVTLDETRRLKGRLMRVIKDGREYAVNATLLDAEGTLGVAAKVREEAPSIAADLIRGSLRGVSDYVTAASQAKSVTVLPGGGVAQSSQTPPLELFMAGSLANLFALQQDKKAVVRVAQADKGTEVVILVVPNQDPAAGK